MPRSLLTTCDVVCLQDACLQQFHIRDSAVNCIAFSTNGYLLIAGSSDGCVTILKPAASRDLALYPWFEPVQTLDLGRQCVIGLCVRLWLSLPWDCAERLKGDWPFHGVTDGAVFNFCSSEFDIHQGLVICLSVIVIMELCRSSACSGDVMKL